MRLQVTIHQRTATDSLQLPSTVQHWRTPPLSPMGGFTITRDREAPIQEVRRNATFTDPGDPDLMEQMCNMACDSGRWPDLLGRHHARSRRTDLHDARGSHTYVEEGRLYPVTVTIHHGTATDTTVTSTAAVADPAVIAVGGFTVTATEGASSGSQTLATFTDPGGPEAVGDYSALVTWGDGQTSAGVITLGSDGQTFTVTGSHTYVEEGSYTVTVTIHHGTATDTTVTSTAAVADPAVIAVGSHHRHRDRRHGFGKSDACDVYRSGRAGSGGRLQHACELGRWPDVCERRHAWLRRADLHGRGQPHVCGGGELYGYGHDPPWDRDRYHGYEHCSGGGPCRQPRGRLHHHRDRRQPSSGSQTLATFTDPGRAGSGAGDYGRRLVNWGDGQTSSSVITLGSDGQTFTVAGSHTYVEEGSYTVTVTIHHGTATDTTVTSTAAVADPAVIAVGGFYIIATEGSPIREVKRSRRFTDPGGPEAVGDYSTLVNWGER